MPKDSDRDLYKALWVKRNTWSVHRRLGFGKVLFSNQTIQNIVEAMPTSDGELLAVKGIGTILASDYGHRILEIVRQHLTPEQRVARIQLLFSHERSRL